MAKLPPKYKLGISFRCWSIRRVVLFHTALRGPGALKQPKNPYATFSSSPDSNRQNKSKAFKIMYIRALLLLCLPTLLCISNLTVALTPWESCHQAIHTFALAVDFRDYALLSKVFSTQFSICKTHHRILAICPLIQCHTNLGFWLTKFVPGLYTRCLC